MGFGANSLNIIHTDLGGRLLVAVAGGIIIRLESMLKYIVLNCASKINSTVAEAATGNIFNISK